MRAKKTLRNRSIHHKTIKNSRGISPVISTIIISGTLLIILVIASFVSANVLELQIASTEFEQAKTNMMLLDEVIQDVSLRRGSGGYVQFNQRSGGIGITKHSEKIVVKVVNPNETVIYDSSELFSLLYRGGSRVSASAESLRGNGSSLNYFNNTNSLSYLRVETGSGVQIKLDYHRIKPPPDNGTKLLVGSETQNFIEITFLKIINGTMGGSGTVNVKVQNIGINTTAWTYQSGNVTIEVQLATGITVQSSERMSFNSTATESVVLFTEIVVQISTA